MKVFCGTAVLILSGLVISVFAASHRYMPTDRSMVELHQASQEFIRLVREGDLDSADALAARLEREWSSRPASEYGGVMLAVCKGFDALDFRDQRQHDLKNKYADLAIAKLAERGEEISVAGQMNLAVYTIRNIDQLKKSAKEANWPTRRTELAGVCFVAWQRIEQAVDPNFSVINPLPYMPIIPQTMKGDSRLRAMMGGRTDDHEYNAKLEQYRAARENYDDQYLLLEMKRTHLSRLCGYLRLLYSDPAFDGVTLDTDALQRDIDKYVAQPTLRKKIFDQLNSGRLDTPAGRPILKKDITAALAAIDKWEQNAEKPEDMEIWNSLTASLERMKHQWLQAQQLVNSGAIKIEFNTFKGPIYRGSWRSADKLTGIAYDFRSGAEDISGLKFHVFSDPAARTEVRAEGYILRFSEHGDFLDSYRRRDRAEQIEFHPGNRVSRYKIVMPNEKVGTVTWDNQGKIKQ